MIESTPTAADRPAVVISLLTLFPGGHGGGETYAREVARRVTTDSRIDGRVRLPRNARGWNGGSGEVVEESVESAFDTVPRLAGMVGLALRPSLDRGYGSAKVVHYLLTVPLPFARRGRRRIVSVADTQHLDLPDLFSRAERFFRRFAYDRAAQRADAVITISEFTKQRLVAVLGLDPARVHVAYLGADTERFRPDGGPRERFLFYPARAWKHKNHGRLFEAFALVRERHPDLRLVLSGASAADFPELPPGVEARGQVSLDELAELYRRAAAVVFPSLYEGFGLPPLEAMASGCPVISSNAGSLPEICGDAAVLVDPDDPAAIAAGVLEGLERADELSERGVERAALFTWQRSADAHIAVYLAEAARAGASAGRR